MIKEKIEVRDRKIRDKESIDISTDESLKLTDSNNYNSNNNNNNDSKNFNKLKLEIQELEIETTNRKVYLTIWSFCINNILHVLALIFYLFSLRGCQQETYICHVLYHRHHIKWLIFYISFSAFLYTIHLLLVIYKGFSKYHNEKCR